MSFFFDVWTYEGFVLASDVRLTLNSQQLFARKIARSAHSSRIVCAIVACGDYAQNCIDFFVEASTTKDTLREIAHCFAEKWTERYSGTEDFSAAHLVGFEKVPGSNIEVPQMWYWNNWDERVGFYKEEQLRKDLSSFSEPVPNNNHLPWKVKEIAGKFPALARENDLEYHRSSRIDALMHGVLGQDRKTFTYIDSRIIARRPVRPSSRDSTGNKVAYEARSACK